MMTQDKGEPEETDFLLGVATLKGGEPLKTANDRIKVGDRIMIDLGYNNVLHRKVEKIELTAEGVHLTLRDAGRAPSERRWAKKKGPSCH